jgi:hypothetical protein
VRIVFGNSSLVNYQQGGGHWSWVLQYPLGLRALGHDVFWLELLLSSGERGHDVRVIRDFFQRLTSYGLKDDCAVLLVKGSLDFQAFEESEVFGSSREHLAEIIRSADLLLNLACALRPPLLLEFEHRVLLDVDPGHLQVSALTWDLGIREHDVLLTIGARVNAPDCEIPTLGLSWRTFEPCVYLPMWQATPDPGPDAPFSSITHWTWEELPWRDRMLSVSKRAAYLEYAELPRRAGRPFELAADIGDDGSSPDRRLLQEHGWELVAPHEVCGSVPQYQQYIRASRAEFMCPKPIHVELKTGWFSDRSIAYLASGRPVLARDTGFSERLPTGLGLVAFRDLEEAVAGVAEIDGHYAQHSRAAREMAEEYFDSRKCLAALLSTCAG